MNFEMSGLCYILFGLHIKKQLAIHLAMLYVPLYDPVVSDFF